MATNNFKAFALDPNANVMSQADWEALPALLSGFTAGKASSAQVNKAIRQSTTIAALVGQFIANSGADALDNADVNGLVTKFTNALITNLGLVNAKFVTNRGSNANGSWVIWSDGAVELMGYNISIVSGLATVTYPIELPQLSRYISIAERLASDAGPTVNRSHVSMVIDQLTTKSGFQARCIMSASGDPSSNGFSWRVYYAPV